jgi:prepilin-type processing-associated H-X9-DG protein
MTIPNKRSRGTQRPGAIQAARELLTALHHDPHGGVCTVTKFDDLEARRTFIMRGWLVDWRLPWKGMPRSARAGLREEVAVQPQMGVARRSETTSLEILSGHQNRLSGASTMIIAAEPGIYIVAEVDGRLEKCESVLAWLMQPDQEYAGTMYEVGVYPITTEGVQGKEHSSYFGVLFPDGHVECAHSGWFQDIDAAQKSFVKRAAND